MTYHGSARYNSSIWRNNSDKLPPISRAEQLRLMEEAIQSGKLRKCLPASKVPTLMFDEALEVLRAGGVQIYERKRAGSICYSLVSNKMTPHDTLIDAARNLIASGRVTWPLQRKEAA